MSKPLYVSISRIKKFYGCSLQYVATYGKKPLPRSSNDGSRIGSVCHHLLEYLLKDKRKFLVNKMIKKDTIYVKKFIKRYISLRCKKEELFICKENLDKINKYCLVALNNDFYCENGALQSAEEEFKIDNEIPYYKVMGLIDKQAKFGLDHVVYDYKSQKKKFVGEDLENNPQGLMYCLAAAKKDPECKPEARFIFLQFPDDPIFIFKPTGQMLTGFEYYLEYCYDQISKFDEVKDAYSNLAYDKGYVTTGEFSGKLLCGRTRRPGELKKDGSPAWECFCKWPQKYYLVLDKITKEFKKSYNTKEGIELKDNEIIQEEKWRGCVRF